METLTPAFETRRKEAFIDAQKNTINQKEAIEALGYTMDQYIGLAVEGHKGSVRNKVFAVIALEEVNEEITSQGEAPAFPR